MAADPAGHIHVYAQRGIPARSWKPVAFDGVTVAEIREGVFFTISASAGRHVLDVRDGVPLAVDVVAGRDVYVRLGFHHQEGRAAIPVLTKAPAGVAAREMKFLSYAPEGRLRSAAVSKVDPRAPVEPEFKQRHER